MVELLYKRLLHAKYQTWSGKLLLNHGAVTNAAPAASGGITALQDAAIRGHINIAQMLIENGAEVNALPALKDGRTAIEGAAEHGRLDIVLMLLNPGATEDVVGNKRFTLAIELARKNHNFQRVELLESQ
ncbi:ankyrin repeat-containing domain protein [Hyaloscypha finlandica]|nr:ankyrin repeat-containing domain protein [Hyaloscypha finlandica]